ncbi:MAG: response regulator, partial [Rhodovarius sp.]|nr:response regulator [Rhodovarius sp.]
LVVPGLAAAGYDLVTVPHGREALRLRDQGEVFDLILSDIHMPEMDGYALVRAIREGGAWQNLPVIALSAQAEAADIARGRDCGFTDYVAKYDRDALAAAIAQALSLRGVTSPLEMRL